MHQSMWILKALPMGSPIGFWHLTILPSKFPHSFASYVRTPWVGCQSCQNPLGCPWVGVRFTLTGALRRVTFHFCDQLDLCDSLNPSTICEFSLLCWPTLKHSVQNIVNKHDRLCQYFIYHLNISHLQSLISDTCQPSEWVWQTMYISYSQFHKGLEAPILVFHLWYHSSWDFIRNMLSKHANYAWQL